MKLNKLFIVPLFLFVAFSYGCKEERSISIVGLDDNGVETTISVDKGVYRNFMSKAVKHLDAETTVALDRLEGTPWEVEHVEVGLAVGATVGLGPIVKSILE